MGGARAEHVFTIINVRSPHGSRGPDPDADLHARARIRNAAIHRFGAEGFGVGLRAIAEDAGVSPALIIRHYGSKAGLREACDEHVLALIRETKTESLATADPRAVLDNLARLDEYGSIAMYVVASLTAGGALATHLFEQMVTDATAYLEEGVAAGVIRPSRDPEARARQLTLGGLGGLLLQLRLDEAQGRRPDVATFMRELEHTTMLPTLELYTYGLFTTSSIYDAVLAAEGVDGGAAHAAPHDVAPDPPSPAQP